MNKDERALRMGKEMIKNYRDGMLLDLFGPRIDNGYNENYCELIKMKVQKCTDAKLSETLAMLQIQNLQSKVSEDKNVKSNQIQIDAKIVLTI